MSANDAYKIELRDMHTSSCEYVYAIDDSFFASLEDAEIKKGNAKATVIVTKKNDAYLLSLAINGNVTVTCDRCLDEMLQPVEATTQLTVKLGDTFNEEDETITIKESDGQIDIRWYLYELIALCIPMQHFHSDGMCNEQMMKKLQEHQVNEVETTTTDPRWDQLRNLMQ